MLDLKKEIRMLKRFIKISMVKSLFLFVIISFSSLNAQIYSNYYEDLSRAYGFCIGQNYSLDKIATEFPDLSLEVQKSRLEFNSAFKSSFTEIENILKKSFSSKWADFQRQMKVQINNSLATTRLTKEQSISFIHQVKARSKGEIESPVLEILLINNPTFKNNPEKEFLEGFTKSYRTKNHYKSKGVDFEIKFPMSWAIKEGIRPNVIQLLTSENGHGFDSIVLMVKEIPIEDNYSISEEELDYLFSKDVLKEIIPSGGEYISSKPITLDRQKGAMLIFQQDMQRMDLTLRMRALHFITIYKNKMISIQCVTGLQKEKAHLLEKRFLKMKQLFWLVGNSFVIHSQY